MPSDVMDVARCGSTIATTHKGLFRWDTSAFYSVQKTMNLPPPMCS